MEIKNLRTFQCAAKFLNFSKAADAVNFSQPTVSTQMQALEAELGQKLFVHIGKRTFLTPEGEMLKEEVDRLLGIIDEIDTKFKSMADSYKIIKIAAHESFCNLKLGDAISKFLTKMDKVDIELFSSHTNEVLEGVRNNKYDIGIISGDISYAGIHCIPIDSTRVDVLTASKIAEKYSLSEIIEKYPYIRYKADAMQYSMDLSQTLHKSNIVPKRVMKFGSIMAIKKVVEEGLGYTVMSRDNVENEIKNNSIRAITPSNVQMLSLTSAICLEDNVERPEIKEFISTLKEVWI